MDPFEQLVSRIFKQRMEELAEREGLDISVERVPEDEPETDDDQPQE